jgi:hypothetical protein
MGVFVLLVIALLQLNDKSKVRVPADLRHEFQILRGKVVEEYIVVILHVNEDCGAFPIRGGIFVTTLSLISRRTRGVAGFTALQVVMNTDAVGATVVRALVVVVTIVYGFAYQAGDFLIANATVIFVSRVLRTFAAVYAHIRLLAVCHRNEVTVLPFP